MGIVNGSLVNNMSNFHLKNKAELAAVVIDSEYKWEFESENSAVIRRKAQQDVLTMAKELDCRTICICNGNRPVPRHVCDVVEEPDFTFNKHERGVFRDKSSMALINFLNTNNITTTVVMGGFLDRCVYLSILGDNCTTASKNYSGVTYPGLLSYGYTILTAPEILYHDFSIDLKQAPRRLVWISACNI